MSSRLANELVVIFVVLRSGGSCRSMSSAAPTEWRVVQAKQRRATTTETCRCSWRGRHSFGRPSNNLRSLGYALPAVFESSMSMPRSPPPRSGALWARVQGEGDRARPEPACPRPAGIEGPRCYFPALAESFRAAARNLFPCSRSREAEELDTYPCTSALSQPEG